MEIAAILSLILAVATLLKEGLIDAMELKAVFATYKHQPATPETIEALRQELLAKAQIQEAIDDPRIRADLIVLGIDPESLRIQPRPLG